MAKSGWDQPLDMQLRFKLNDLNSLIKQYTPVGNHSHDQGVKYTNFAPRTGGRLKRSWKLSKSDGISLLPDGKGVSIRNKLPWAMPTVMGRKPNTISGKIMRWSGGFARSVRHPGYGPNDFLERAVSDWWGKKVQIKWRGKSGAKAVAD